jgi:type II secretory pathway pseudopilin PulG
MREKNNGQSLVEVLIAVAIGAILITGGVMLIVPALQSNSQATKVQAASLLGKQLLDNVRVWSEGNWNNVLALSTGTSYVYYMNTSSSPFTVATGTESIAVATGTVATSSLTSGLVGYWPLDEGTGNTSGTSKTADLSGYGNTGTWYGVASGTSGYYSPGKIGAWAGTFDGVDNDDYIQIPNSSSLSPSNAWTISAWVQPQGSNTALGEIVSKWQSSAGTTINYSLDAGLNGSHLQKLRATVSPSGGGSGVSVTGNTTLNFGTWYYVAAVFNGVSTTLSVYVNGQSDATPLTTSFTQCATNIGNPRIGSFDFSWASYKDTWTGLIDDVRVYNRALSAAEISQLYALGQSNVTYTRYFYISDVYRDGSGNIVTSGGTYDPSTKQITVVYSWPNGPVNTMTTYIVRGRNNVVSQNSWSGGPGVTTPETSTNNQFASSTNIDYTTSTGSIYVAIPGY